MAIRNLCATEKHCPGYAVQFRLSKETSGRLGQYQGILKHMNARTSGGNPITLAWLFENVMFPALADWMRPYVEEVKLARTEGSSDKTKAA